MLSITIGRVLSVYLISSKWSEKICCKMFIKTLYSKSWKKDTPSWLRGQGELMRRSRFFIKWNIRKMKQPFIFGPFPKVAQKKRQRRRFMQKRQKRTGNQSISGLFLVEVTGFEPATFWSRTKRATKLRYTSMEPMKGLEPLTCGLRNRCSTNWATLAHPKSIGQLKIIAEQNRFVNRL